MKITYRYIFIFIIILFTSMLASCVDDTLDYFDSENIPQGETEVTLHADFAPFAEGALTRAAAPQGNVMSDISDICVIAYDKDGNLVEGFPREISDYVIEDTPRADSDASNGVAAEFSTKRASFSLTIPYGRYRIYAIANLGRYVSSGNKITTISSTFDELSPGGKYHGKYDTADDLRALRVSWDNDEIANNREMLGFFADGDEISAPHSGSSTPLLTVNRSGISLRTWMRRCASKVTIDFDGSELRDNVHIYIRRATVRDIASDCSLGFGLGETRVEGAQSSFNNSITSPDKMEARSNSFIEYGEGENFSAWPKIAKGAPYIMENDAKKDLHKLSAPSLFFYENMQGDSPIGKQQIPNFSNGGVSGAGNLKDGVDYGTYVEVEGYYYSNADGNISQGPITYRFMLGKDVEKNCDAERNYHYRLTLKFRGNANDYDWHIDYIEDSGFDVPNPWYVSYLYNHMSEMPFKYTAPAGWKVESVTAQIVHNPWYPDDMDASLYASSYKNENKYLGNGFLSLRATKLINITDAETGVNSESNFYTTASNAYVNDNYFYGKTAGSDGVDRSKRQYWCDGTPDPTNTGKEAYSYKKEGEKYTFKIPLYTRPKNMVKPSGYTGNNPYEGHTRTAKLKISVKISKISNPASTKTVSETINVIQVRRITNPTGVYRKSGNNENFHVLLTHLMSDNDTEFSTFTSDGPWMAEIIGDANFITLDGRQIVEGSTGSNIDFTIRFNKTNTDAKIRNAVVRVRYHNYTCTHLIFVRQGYDPMKLEDTTWRTFNLITSDKEADDPRDEGSLFKFANHTQPIDARSNANISKPWINVSPASFSKVGTLYKADGSDKPTTTIKWADIADVSGDATAKSKGFTYNRVATMAQFQKLYAPPVDNDADKVKVWHGFGVLYADGATEVQMNVNDAFGYWRGDADKAKRGMRGVFVYHWDVNTPNDPDNCKNIFFPIGRSGYGHRRHYDEYSGTNRPGMLRYSSGRTAEFPYCNIAPLFYDLYKRPGAIYWARKITNNVTDWSNTVQKEACGLDLNYFSFDVNLITLANVMMKSGHNGSDACFLRCVGSSILL